MTSVPPLASQLELLQSVLHKKSQAIVEFLGFGHKPVEDIQSSWSDEATVDSSHLCPVASSVASAKDGAPWVQVGSSSSGASTEKA